MARRVRRKPGKKLSTAAWFGIGCGATILLGIIGIIVLWALATGQPAPPPEATAVAPGDAPSGRSQAAPAAPPLERQIEQVQQAARSERPVPVTMTLRESEINEMLAGSDSPEVRDLAIYLGDGTIAGTAKVRYRGSTIPLTVRGRPVVSDGRVQVEVREVFIGRLPAPESIRRQVSTELDGGIERIMGTRNVRVQSVQVRPDVMIISGSVGGR